MSPQLLIAPNPKGIVTTNRSKHYAASVQARKVAKQIVKDIAKDLPPKASAKDPPKKLQALKTTNPRRVYALRSGSR